MKRTFYSNGKLLLTGEYLVLDGATALAIPTKKGQSLTVLKGSLPGLQWTSLDEKGDCWFEARFSLGTLDIVTTNKMDIAITLSQILKAARELQPSFLASIDGIQIRTELQFPRNWGLGTSSTLINNIAQWAQVDAYALLTNSFGGSGYDIAAASHDKPILYSIVNGRPDIQEIQVSWDFTSSIFFVHLNQKQQSKEGISHYRQKPATVQQREKISDLSRKLLLCYTLRNFEAIVNAHETIVSDILDRPTVKDTLFPDYHGSIKSLGAWGGDFMMVTGSLESMSYFKNKGYNTIIPFSEMVLYKM